LRAQDAPPPPPASSAPATGELTTLRESVLAALNASDFDKLLPLLTPNVVLTFQNAEVARGREGVKTFLKQNTGATGALVQTFRIEAKADDTPKYYGERTAILTGSAAETLRMANGKDLELVGRWTATVVREDGGWQLAALHTSTDLFANPLIEVTKKAGVTASVASLLIGMFAGWMIGRKRPI
jgi:ketosteroid isomerase-like protein